MVLVGDSAGGNFAASLLLRVLNERLPRPIGLILIYPNLDYNIHSWMSDDQMALFKSQSMKEIPSGVLDTKQNYERRKSVLQLTPDSEPSSFLRKESTRPPSEPVQALRKKKNPGIATRLAMTSRVAFSQDRIITTELMRAMAILYIGPKNKPDFNTDYMLSPIIAPSELFMQFPKTYLMCGEKDPLVDDTILLAGRIREAKRAQRRRYRGMQMSTREAMDAEWVELMLIRGVSHGFLQMTAFLKEGRVAVDKVGTWLEELFSDIPNEKKANGADNSKVTFSIEDGESDEEDEKPLEIHSSRQMSPEKDGQGPQSGSSPRRTSPVKDKDDKRNHYRHDTWESRNVLQEHMLMERRREALTRGLEVTGPTDTAESTSSAGT